jgi:hypothetical protein
MTKQKKLQRQLLRFAKIVLGLKFKNVYDRKFYDSKLSLSLERSYDRTIVILAKAS